MMRDDNLGVTAEIVVLSNDEVGPLLPLDKSNWVFVHAVREIPVSIATPPRHSLDRDTPLHFSSLAECDVIRPQKPLEIAELFDVLSRSRRRDQQGADQRHAARAHAITGKTSPATRRHRTGNRTHEERRTPRQMPAERLHRRCGPRPTLCACGHNIRKILAHIRALWSGLNNAKRIDFA